MPWRPNKRTGWGTLTDRAVYSFSQVLRGVLEVVPGGVIRYGKTAYGDDEHVGFWLGVDLDGLAKFNLGGPVHYLKWTGTELLVSGGINATSGTITGTLMIGSGGQVVNEDMALDDTGLQITARVSGGFEPAQPRGVKWRAEDGLGLGLLNAFQMTGLGNFLKLRLTTPSANRAAQMYLQVSSPNVAAIYFQVLDLASPDGTLPVEASPVDYMALGYSRDQYSCQHRWRVALKESVSVEASFVPDGAGGVRVFQVGMGSWGTELLARTTVDASGESATSYIRLYPGFGVNEGVQLGYEGSESRLRFVADAVDETDGLNRRTGDGRYLMQAAGWSGTFATGDGRTVTVANGQVVGVA